MTKGQKTALVGGAIFASACFAVLIGLALWSVDELGWSPGLTVSIGMCVFSFLAVWIGTMVLLRRKYPEEKGDKSE